MLYILVRDSALPHCTVDHVEAQQLYADAVKEATDDESVRLLQLQADVVAEHIPAPPRPVDTRPLTDAESRTLADLLARHQANAPKGGG